MNNKNNTVRKKKKGYIILNGEMRMAVRYGFSTESAEHNVLKTLANMSRAHHEGIEGWTYWPKLPQAEQKKWLDYVTENVQWDYSNGGRTE